MKSPFGMAYFSGAKLVSGECRCSIFCQTIFLGGLVVGRWVIKRNKLPDLSNTPGRMTCSTLVCTIVDNPLHFVSRNFASQIFLKVIQPIEVYQHFAFQTKIPGFKTMLISNFKKKNRAVLFFQLIHPAGMMPGSGWSWLGILELMGTERPGTTRTGGLNGNLLGSFFAWLKIRI